MKTRAIGLQVAVSLSAAFACARRNVAPSIDLPGLAGWAYKIRSTAFPSLERAVLGFGLFCPPSSTALQDEGG
jgi:hypothetical protein